MKNNDWLDIFIVTYNRINNLKYTLEQLLADSSPIKNYSITILDNNSTDGTSELIEEYARRYPNIKHIKHNRNIGANANIARAYELASKDYLWILADDDNYDFSAWEEVETAKNAGESMIMVAKYALPKKPDPDRLLGQVTFVPSMIISAKLLDDTVIRNIYDNIFTMYVQLVPVVMALNENKKIYLIKGNAVVNNGDDYNAQNPSWFHSPIYHRGANAERLSFRSATMAQAVGISNVLELLKNNKIKKLYMENKIDAAVHYSNPFLKEFIYFADLWVNFDKRQKLKCILKLLRLDKIIWIEYKGKKVRIKLFNILKISLKRHR